MTAVAHAITFIKISRMSSLDTKQNVFTLSLIYQTDRSHPKRCRKRLADGTLCEPTHCLVYWLHFLSLSLPLPLYLLAWSLQWRPAYPHLCNPLGSASSALGLLVCATICSLKKFPSQFFIQTDYLLPKQQPKIFIRVMSGTPGHGWAHWSKGCSGRRTPDQMININNNKKTYKQKKTPFYGSL